MTSANSSATFRGDGGRVRTLKHLENLPLLQGALPAAGWTEGTEGERTEPGSSLFTLLSPVQPARRWFLALAAGILNRSDSLRPAFGIATDDRQLQRRQLDALTLAIDTDEAAHLLGCFRKPVCCRYLVQLCCTPGGRVRFAPGALGTVRDRNNPMHPRNGTAFSSHFQL